MSTLEFDQQFDAQKKVLFSFALNLTKNEDNARELVQETAYKAYRYRHRFHPETNMRAWLMTIMRNSFINDYRKRRRRQTLQDFTNNNFLLDSGKQQVVENEGERRALQQEVERALSSLEDMMRIPFLLHYQGYKYEEIANQLEIPLGTVKSRIFAARQKMQKELRLLYHFNDWRELLN